MFLLISRKNVEFSTRGLESPGQKKDFFSKESEGGKWRTDVWESVQISWSTPSDWNKGSVIGSWAQCGSSQPRGLCQNTTLNIKFHISQSGLIDYCLVVSKIANHKNAQNKWIYFDSQWGFKIKVSTTTYLYNLHFLVLLCVTLSASEWSTKMSIFGSPQVFEVQIPLRQSPVWELAERRNLPCAEL